MIDLYSVSDLVLPDLCFIFTGCSGLTFAFQDLTHSNLLPFPVRGRVDGWQDVVARHSFLSNREPRSATTHLIIMFPTSLQPEFVLNLWYLCPVPP